MKIIKNKDNVELKNEFGSYHFSLEDYKKHGEIIAIKIAEKEIQKKLKDHGKLKTINFSQARDMGFCEFGIQEFCEELNLDIAKEYSIDFLNKRLTLDVIQKYPNEIFKIFGADCIKYLGTIQELINETNLNLFLCNTFIDEKTLHILSTKFARMCLENYEKEYPNDMRIRQAIEAKEAWIRGGITSEQLLNARNAAWSASRNAARNVARNAAWSAEWSAWNAESAARNAAWNAAWSAAWSAESAARNVASVASNAARNAVWSATRKKQVQIVIEVLDER